MTYSVGEHLGRRGRVGSMDVVVCIDRCELVQGPTEVVFQVNEARKKISCQKIAAIAKRVDIREETENRSSDPKGEYVSAKEFQLRSRLGQRSVYIAEPFTKRNVRVHSTKKQISSREKQEETVSTKSYISSTSGREGGIYRLPRHQLASLPPLLLKR